MFVPMGTMDVAVSQFLCGGGPYCGNRTIETQSHAGQRMIAVHDHLVFCNISYGEDQDLVGMVGFCGWKLPY